jgi:hypothetical protein
MFFCDNLLLVYISLIAFIPFQDVAVLVLLSVLNVLAFAIASETIQANTAGVSIKFGWSARIADSDIDAKVCRTRVLNINVSIELVNPFHSL